MMNPVVHFEMPYRDAARAAAFYAQAFGWETENLGPAMGDYLLVTTARSDAKPGSPAGAINGGLYSFKPDWPAQHPALVIAVESMDAAMQRVHAAGGQVLGAPMDIAGVGAYVAFIDTEGNRNSLLQPAMPG